MKRHPSDYVPFTRTTSLLALLVLLATLSPQLSATPLGTAFTYQGELADGANPAQGIFDFRFVLYDDSSGSGVIAGPVTNAAVAVSNGLFTTTLDFGPGVFTGNARWLAIGVRTGGGGAFTPLTPRQPLTPTPFAQYAPSAGNAALLNGQSPIAYAPATGSSVYVAKTGDTMSGPLVVPVNGLRAGTNQLVLSGGNVGIGAGTNLLAAPLDVRGTNSVTASANGILNIGPPSSYHLTLDVDDLQAKVATNTTWLNLNYYGGGVNLCAGQLYAVYGSGVGIGSSNLFGWKFYVNGSACSTGGWIVSDARWKKNVQPVTGALNKITQLQGVTYDWRRDEFPEKNFEDGSQLGFLAQDVEKIVPEAVRTDASGYKAIAYEKLTAVLAEGVKEQQAEIGALKARNTTLEKDVAELKALVEQLLHK